VVSESTGGTRVMAIDTCHGMSYIVDMTTQTEHALAIPKIGFGDRLRRVRINAGMTQDTFGESIGISGATVGKYELLDHEPKMARPVAAAVQLRFGIPADWLLTGREPTGFRPPGLHVSRQGLRHVLYGHPHNHPALAGIFPEPRSSALLAPAV
jgi:transcriptional regulator with XRE-family HTH domain